MAYRRARGRDTWHWSPDCSHWPTFDYEEQQSKPATGELCNECRSKAAASSESVEQAAHDGVAACVSPNRDEIWMEIDHIRSMTPAITSDSTPLIREDRDNDEPYR